MSYDQYESSRQLGIPIQLFKFKYGSAANACYTYTDAEEPLTYDDGLGDGPKVYEPIAIMRGSINSSGTLDKSKLELRIDKDTEIGALYRGYPPSYIVTLTIRAHHIGDTEYPIIWSGIVRGGGPAEGEIVLTCEPISTQMKRTGLRRHYQYGCPHVLYGIGKGLCNADKDAATYTGTVASATNTTLTLDAGWNGSIAAAKFAGGILEWTNDDGNLEIRMINSASGTTLNVKGVLRDIHAGNTVSVILGCAHNEDDCQNLHVEKDVGGPNINNFGGQSWIPTENPVAKNQSY